MFWRIRRLDLVADAAQREREVLLIGLPQDQLDRAIVELDDVLEDEQQAPDLGGELLIGLGQRVEHVALGGAIGLVEDLGERLDAAGGRVTPAGRSRRASLASPPRPCLHDVRAGLAHPRDPQRDLGLIGSRAGREHLRGERCVQVGDDERDRLRRLVAQERDDLLGRVRRRNSNGRISITVARAGR